jgi:hypothetical protein
MSSFETFSLLLAHSVWSDGYTHFWHYTIGSHPIEYWINDGLMTLFFLLIGLELEREIYAGELANFKKAFVFIQVMQGRALDPPGIRRELNRWQRQLATDADGWLGAKVHVDVPYLTNLRLDPFERTGWPDNGSKEGAQQYFDWFKYEFWRFVFVQQQVEKLAMTAIEFPPMQKGASFNLDAVKAKIEAARSAIGK